MKWDFTSPPSVYWTEALERIEKRRKLIAKCEPSEKAWQQLGRLNKLEELARFCLEAAGTQPPDREPGE
jgi:hypothetical protein